ncbi:MULTISPECIES: hypothetical protein [unclassified Streptomyces]|uniref:hypothetical protein n=1 Tax=unclassified Streptomyces TaxID=2593676 RepID=UPI00225B0F9E|nr:MULTISPECIES: hypothetical protein [unclassified Streptomyces]MCX5051586.1 hypothetical protein [Streptomyces sp. NBC_00474]
MLDEVVHGCDGIKPGWTRINFNYFISDTVRDYLIAAVDLIATHGHRLLPDFRFDPHTGQWRHHAGATDPPLRLTDVRYSADGRLSAPAPRHRRLGGGTGRSTQPRPRGVHRLFRPSRQRPHRAAGRLRAHALVPAAARPPGTNSDRHRLNRVPEYPAGYKRGER